MNEILRAANGVRRFCVGILVMAVVATSPVGRLSAATPAPIGSGDLKSLAAYPQQVRLVGLDAMQQLVVTGQYTNQGIRDLTLPAKFRVDDATIADVSSSGLLTPVANGTTQVVVEVRGQTARMNVTVTGTDADQPINFTNEIVPILTKFGCNAGDCHGKAEGQNGFKLSLLGFDAKADYNALVREGRGRRVRPAAAEHSLLLTKSTGRVGHGGGKPLAMDAPECQLLTRWIRSGTPFGSDDDPHVIGISVYPDHRIVPRRAIQQLAVIAHFSDGSTSDVTRRTEFKSNDEATVDVDRNGVVETQDQFGEGSVMVRYLGHVNVFLATIPLETTPANSTQHAPANFVDEHVFAKLNQLKLPPSELCTDGEFLRRASVDITGTLPTAAEAKNFLEDADPQKRSKLIDDLLNRPAYAKYFTLKWGDILRLRGGVRDPLDKVEAKRKAAAKKKLPVMDTMADRADRLQAWIRESLETNKPYDQFVREIVTTTGDTVGADAPAPSLWYLELKLPQGLVDDTAQAFLGTRIQCAQCHHHPFEKWSQEDYWGLATFFGRVQWQMSHDKNGQKLANVKPVRISEAGRLGQSIGFNPEGKLTDPQGREFINPKALGADELVVAPGDDPRHKLVDWMVQPDNPFFARALVNRYWGHFFSRAISVPLDDMRVTNPPSNPALLDALAADFIQHKFDLKHLIRTICNSKTYQLSSRPNEFNTQDEQNYARYIPKRLPAEVLHDAIDQVTNSPTLFVAKGGFKFPEGTRAIELPDAYVSSYFLDVFGRPPRNSACDCEREPSVTLAQRVHLLNSGAIGRKVGEQSKKLLADERPVADKLGDLYLSAFSRFPIDPELKRIEDYIASKSDSDRNKEQAYFDVVWAVINTKEFAFNH